MRHDMTTRRIRSAELDRRMFLRSVGLMVAGGALAACGAGEPAASGPEASSQPSRAAGAGDDPGAAAVARVAPDAEASLAVVAASFEYLADQPNPLVFGLFTLEQEPIENMAAQVSAIPPGGGEPLGPWDATPAQVDVPPGGLYLAGPEFTSTGVYQVVVVTDDGRAGTVALDVRDAASSQLPAPGDQAPAVPTPTDARPRGYATLCTRTPEPCGMHEVSLDEALRGDRPVVMLFATPAFCQTAVCGPTVDVLEQIRADYRDVTFIHCEIFSDEGATVGDPVAAWELPTEPWMFTIDPNGSIVRRADGPLLVVADQVRSLIDDVQTA